MRAFSIRARYSIAAVIGLIACKSEPQKPPDVVPTDKLVVVIQSSSQYAELTKTQDADNKIVVSALAGDLVAVLAVERPTGVEMVTARKLRELKLDEYAAFDLARKNLAATHGALKLTKMEGTPVFTNDEDNDDIAATMILPDAWKPFASQVKGKLLLAVPGRNRVFATGSEDDGAEEGISKIAGLAFQAEPHPLTTTIFELSSTGWIVHPSGGHQ
jgi:hypothetical protein